MRMTKAFYTTDNSDLLIHVIAIPYQNTEYAKVKLRLSNKKNGIAYDTRPKHHKVYFKNIVHWIKLNTLNLNGEYTLNTQH